MKLINYKTKPFKILIIVGLTIISGMSVMIVPINASAAVGESDSNFLDDEWYLDLNTVYGWGWLGITPAIVNLPGVNNYGGEPASDLEIVAGSDMATGTM